MLHGKNIILAVSGSIAAYKAAFITREFIKAGASVKVILTEAAEQFVTPITLAALSKNPVLKDFVKDDDSGSWNNHVDLGIWADAFVLAPATANTLSKMADGHADNFMLATYLSARCPVFVAPAMDLDMYKHPANQENITKLKKQGVYLISPESGELASGLVGEGRMAEPENIVKAVKNQLKKMMPFYNKRFLVTAGPTFEAIDPVRFIGNHSSGKMGFSIAEEAARLGADVTLISGPVSLITPPGVTRVDITSAEEMFKACQGNFKDQDIIIMSAAVADYTPEFVADQKIKKVGEQLEIRLKKTTDILSWLGNNKTEKQFLVGFALETEKEEEHAKDKLERKKLDMIVLNSLNNEGAGFKHDTNLVTLFFKDNKELKFELKSKLEVAKDILENIKNRIDA